MFYYYVMLDDENHGCGYAKGPFWDAGKAYFEAYREAKEFISSCEATPMMLSNVTLDLSENDRVTLTALYGVDLVPYRVTWVLFSFKPSIYDLHS